MQSRTNEKTGTSDLPKVGLTVLQGAEPRFSGYKMQAFPFLLPIFSPFLFTLVLSSHQKSTTLLRLSPSYPSHRSLLVAQGSFCPDRDHNRPTPVTQCALLTQRSAATTDQRRVLRVW